MKIKKIRVYRYSIPFKFPVKLGRTVLEKRDGLVISITTENGERGFGEIAPLSGFSRESLLQAETQFKLFIKSHSGSKSIEELEKSIGNLYPSVRFAIECALIELKAKSGGVSAAEILNKNFRQSVSVNGLLTGTKNEIINKAVEYARLGYKTVKLKAGSNNIDYDIELTNLVRNEIGGKVEMRLDANRGWNRKEAEKFGKAVSQCRIEYLEEPFLDSKMLREALENDSPDVPVALDETTREISPAELGDYKGIKAVVLKPTMLGIKETLEFVKEAEKMGITPVIGSSFESGLGLSFLAKMAAAVNKEDISAGLDTYSWFADDIIKGSLPVKNGLIEIVNLPDSETVLHSGLLKIIDEP